MPCQDHNIKTDEILKMEEHLYCKITIVTSLMTKILMSEPLPSRTEEVQVMSRQKLKVVMELLNRPHNSYSLYGSTWTHTVAGLLTVRAGMEKKVLWDEKEGIVQIVCHCPALAFKRYRTLGHIFLTPRDL